jgi:hypothetical protein
MPDLPGLDWTFVVPVIGLVMVMWGFARRIQALIWLGLAALVALPAIALVERVLDS